MVFEFVNSENGINITGFEGADSILEIPSSINDIPVISIAKKAFMGRKNLVEVRIPGSVLRVDDWAFAQCAHLRKAVIERRDDTLGEGLTIELGKGVFEGCKKLENICINETEDDVSYLLGACVHRLPAVSLLTDADAGTPFWIERFDLCLKSFLARDDMEGYDDTALCGEEDISTDGIGSIDGELPGEGEAFVREACKNKSYLALLRLLHSSFLSDNDKEYFENYVRAHSYRRLNEAAWILIKEDLGNNREFIDLFLNTVTPDKDIIAAMIKDTGEKHALLKSRLIAFSGKGASEDDLFGSLLL